MAVRHVAGDRQAGSWTVVRPETGEVPFQWICGGVSVNYHTLADFRTRHVELLDEIFLAASRR